MSQALGIGRRKLIQQIVTTNWAVKNPEEKRFSFQELLYVIQEMTDEEGKHYYEPGTSLRGFYIFRDFVKHLLYRNLANYDSMVLITADKGVGKSSAAIMMAREWCKLIGIRFDPNRHIAYNNADVMNKIDSLNRFEPIIADEAVRFASSAEWNKRENRELRKKLAQARTKHLFYILCFPLKAHKLEKTYLESFVNYWVDLFGRGTGAIYVKDKNPNQDSWRLKEFDKIGSYTEFTQIGKIQQKLRNHPNFWTVIKFPKPPGWLYKRYIDVREKNVYDDDNVLQNLSKEDMHNALLVLSLRDILMHDQTLSINRIILHIKNQYDVNITKGMVTAAIEDANQLVTKIREHAIQQ